MNEMQENEWQLGVAVFSPEVVPLECGSLGGGRAELFLFFTFEKLFIMK